MKRLTYKVEEEKTSLVYEEITDSNNNVVYYKDYQSVPVSEKRTTYNSLNLLSFEVEVSDDVEISKQEFEYNLEGELTGTRLFIDGDVFEEMHSKQTEQGLDKSTYRNGELVEKYLQHKNSDDFYQAIYENGELVASYSQENNLKNRTSKYIQRDTENEVVFEIVDYLNDFDMLDKTEEFNSENELVEESIFEYEGKKIKKVTVSGGELEYTVDFEYDESNNLIKKEINSFKGEVLGVLYQNYDTKNRLIEESGVGETKMENLYSSYIASLGFHFMHEYED